MRQTGFSTCVPFPGHAKRSSLHAVTYLAPKLLSFYQYVGRYLEEKLGLSTRMTVGSSYDELPGRIDLAFICGLPYVELERTKGPMFEPIAAPVVQGERYGGRPIYFSDVIVQRNSSYGAFADLRGRSWAFNEPLSHSGYGITRFHLVHNGETGGYFSEVVEAGYHERAVRMVCDGEVDASAIDSHVLALIMRDEPVLKEKLRIIAAFGPSTIQPIVVARRLSAQVKKELRHALLAMGTDVDARPQLDDAMVEHFAAVTDETYDDIRQMLAVTEAAKFSVLR